MILPMETDNPPPRIELVLYLILGILVAALLIRTTELCLIH